MFTQPASEKEKAKSAESIISTMTLASSAMSTRRKTLLGFSLIEVLAAVAIIGIITFLAIPNIIRIRQESEQSLAESRVEALNLGMASLVQAQGPSAAADLWSGANTDQARYELIRPYLAFAPATLSNYLPAGYSASLPQSLLPLSPASLTLPPTVEDDPEEPEG